MFIVCKYAKEFLLLVVCWCAGLLSVLATGNYSTTYVSLNRQDALLYAPDTLSAKSGVAVVVMHSDENYMGFVANAELARRGNRVLAIFFFSRKCVDRLN